MKHLSADARSRRRRCGPRSRTTSTSIVLRALAKDPADRYRRAEEMDADLARVARGLPRRAGDRGGGDARSSPAPADATRADASCRARRRRPRPPAAAGRLLRLRRAARAGRPIWPWLVSALLRRRRGVAGWLRVHEDPGPARREQAGRGADLSRPAGEPLAVRKIRTRASSRSHAASRTTTSRRDRVRAGPGRPATRIDEGQHRHDPRLDREAEGGGAGRASARLGRRRRRRSPTRA